MYFIQNTKCYLQCRSVKADGFPLKDQIWLMCRAAWDPPSVGKPLRPGKLPQVEEDGWGQRCFFTFALSGNSLHPDSKLRVIHAQGILMFCSFLENLSVLDTAEELLFIKKKKFRHYYSPSMTILQQFLSKMRISGILRASRGKENLPF